MSVMKGKPKRKLTNREALWPDDPLTDKHNDRVMEQLAKQLAKEKDDERLAE